MAQLAAKHAAGCGASMQDALDPSIAIDCNAHSGTYATFLQETYIKSRVLLPSCGTAQPLCDCCTVFFCKWECVLSPCTTRACGCCTKCLLSTKRAGHKDSLRCRNQTEGCLAAWLTERPTTICRWAVAASACPNLQGWKAVAAQNLP